MSRIDVICLRCLVFVILIGDGGLVRRAIADEPAAVNLTATRQSQQIRAKVVLEVDGSLLPDGEGANPLTLKAVGNFLYQERLLDADQRRFIRYYEQAQADVAIDRDPDQITLPEDRRYILVDPNGEPGFRAIEGGLSREELEMVEVPGGSHLIDEMLPGRLVKIDESWPHTDDVMARLLNLDTVNGNDVKTCLKSLDGEIAQLETSGKVIGAVGGSMTEIQLTGKIRFDLSKGHVTWAALGIQEKRESGPTSPGLDVRARMRLLREPSISSRLSEAMVKSLTATAASPQAEPFEYRSSSGLFRLTHDPRWHLYREQDDLIVFRMIDQGRVLAHCNLRPLSPLPVGQQLELVDFEKDVRSALGTAARQVVDAREGGLPNHIRQLRVAVVGEASGLPIHWIYYHLDNAKNRRMSCVFTMRAADIETFGAQDATFVSGLDLDPPEDSVEDVARKP